MKDYVRTTGAPEVRAIQPSGSDLAKPVLLYLPGIELSGYTLHSQTQELSEDFSLHYLTVGQDDRTSFEGLVDVVCDAIDRLANEPVAAAAAVTASEAAAEANRAAVGGDGGEAELLPAAEEAAAEEAAAAAAAAAVAAAPPAAAVAPRAVYLLGESFGGALGLAVALRSAATPNAAPQAQGCTHTRTHTHTHTHTHTLTLRHAHPHTHTYTHTCRAMWTWMCACMSTCACVPCVCLHHPRNSAT